MARSDDPIGPGGLDSPEVQPSDPWIGRTLGSYTIIRRIGEGGMGIVYLGEHESLRRPAAIKFLPAELAADAGYVELFFREARAAAKLNHPNIVTVYDAGHTGSLCYFIMEYVEGENLRDRLRSRGSLPVAEVLPYMRQAAAALAYAHQRGIVHRDVKPENLMLTPEGIIKVGDLGLAKWVGDEDGTFTQGEWVLGSPVYISPERLRDAHFIDPRVDIYSLGGTFYHLVTGKLPYEGSSPVIMAQHLTAPVPDPRESNPIIDARIGAIIRKMMAKELTDRYQTMDEVDDALEEYENTAGSGAAAPGETAPAPAPIGSPFPKYALAAAVVLFGVALGWWMLSGKSRSPAPGPSASAAVATPAPAPPASSVLLLANFDSSLSPPAGSFGSGANLPHGGRFEQWVDPKGGMDGAGAWRISYNIPDKKDASCRAWIILPSVDATSHPYLSFRIRSTMPMDVPIGFAFDSRHVRHVVRGVGEFWMPVSIPLQSDDSVSLKGLSLFEVFFEPEISPAGKAMIFIDQLALSSN